MANHLQKLRELHTMYRDPKISSWYKTNEMVKWMDCDLPSLILWMENQTEIMRQAADYMSKTEMERKAYDLGVSVETAEKIQQLKKNYDKAVYGLPYEEEPLEVEIRIEPCGEPEPVVRKYRRVRK